MNFYLASQKVIPDTKSAIVIGNSLGYDLILGKGKYHNVNTRTLVEGLGPCIKLTAWGGKDKFEAHSAPELENINNIEQKINDIIDGLRGRMRKSFDDIHAFITGGIEYNPQNPVSEKSMNLIEKIYEALQKEGVPTSVIAAQKSDGLNTRLNTLGFNNNMYIYGKPIDEVLLSDKTDLKEALEDNFDFVEFADDFLVSSLK